jgi:hypothetical protein
MLVNVRTLPTIAKKAAYRGAKRLTLVTERHKDELRALQTEKTAIQLRLQTAEKLADQQKAVDIQRVRVELETNLRSEQSQKEDLNRRVEDYFTEVKQLRERKGDSLPSGQ